MVAKYYDLNFESKRTYFGSVGYFDENEYRALRVDVSSVLADYPDAAFRVAFQRAKDTHPYEKNLGDVTLENNKLVVVLKEVDYNIPGRLQIQITFESGSVTGKSSVFLADVGDSLSSDTTDPKSPYADALAEIDEALDKIDEFISTGGGSIALDKTLTVEGKAADAKAVGDAIEAAKGGLFVVTADLATGKASHSASEIIAAYNAGKQCALDIVGMYLEYVHIPNAGSAVFRLVNVSGKGVQDYIYEVREDKTIQSIGTKYAYDLPIASESKLGGVQPVTATEDMTQPVGVDGMGRMFTAPGGGGSCVIPVVTTTGDGKWYKATSSDVGELYHGLTIAVKFHVTNTENTVYFNLNGTGNKSVYARSVERAFIGVATFAQSFIKKNRPILLTYNEGQNGWFMDTFISTTVSGGGTGKNFLTSGSYLVGEGTSPVALKTPAQVLADILPSTTDDVGKVPVVQEDGKIALAEVSGGGLFVVTVDISSNTASHSASEIIAAHDAGKACEMNLMGMLLTYAAGGLINGKTIVSFASPTTIDATQVFGITVDVHEDKSINMSFSTYNYTLPTATETTLGGVKPVAKTDDMTTPVGIDANGQLWAKVATYAEASGVSF